MHTTTRFLAFLSLFITAILANHGTVPGPSPPCCCATGAAMCSKGDEAVSRCKEGALVDEECKKYEICVESGDEGARCVRIQDT
jgi:hypothetical protein